jgi:tryptophan halogenase
LLGKTLAEPFLSYKSTLFCDRAVVGGWDRTNEPVHPYTTCSTMNGGWMWQIEHEGRINRGYVYSSPFISDDEAEREFRSVSPKVGPTRVVKFVSGRYERAWVKNVVAIGNASAFVEPLEATALGMIGMRSRLLSEVLMECDRRVIPVHVDLYNRHHAMLWESIRKFLAIHYKFNARLDTPFWRECREKTDLAGAEPVVEYYRQSGPSGLWGPAVVDDIEPFPLGSYLTLLVGQKVPHEMGYTPPDREWAIWNAERQKNRSAAAGAMTVPEALAAARSKRQAVAS